MDVITAGAGVLPAVLLLAGIGVTVLVTRLFRKVEQGKALIISKVRRVDVTFTGAVVLPVLHRAGLNRVRAVAETRIRALRDTEDRAVFAAEVALVRQMVMSEEEVDRVVDDHYRAFAQTLGDAAATNLRGYAAITAGLRR